MKICILGGCQIKHEVFGNKNWVKELTFCFVTMIFSVTESISIIWKTEMWWVCKKHSLQSVLQHSVSVVWCCSLLSQQQILCWVASEAKKGMLGDNIIPKVKIKRNIFNFFAINMWAKLMKNELHLQ